ncbi:MULTISPECIES: DMT family transporter [Bacteria]|jgi:small multidrug resistance pump|uniref:Ethidium bromide-methyl viologen resistance protein EmrE n=1 Tax=Limimaricola cinnabarinus LL-001 TaxID=1337093 RepID=U3AB21_9RHOB|nr:multidrug efflux SMR transporter [Limimaricola cinnabarinus]GAD54854.1 ethidium bromide-methyl viologen resistance protein EmrE [Limimaricola cinnabarinus LL-001]
MPWIVLFFAIACETVATTALHASQQFTRPGPAVVAVLGYCLSFYLLSLALEAIPVGIAYAIWAGLGIVLIAAIGWTLFGQKLDAAALVGMSLILSGIVVINVFSGNNPH